MKGRSNKSKISLEIEMRKKADTDNSEKKEDKRKSPAVKSRNFDGTTPVEAFLQQFRVYAHYYNWIKDESSVQIKCVLSGDAATLVWSQINTEQLTVAQLQELLRERYGSAMQEDKFQAELRDCRQKAHEDLPTLRADISRLMSLAFPGDVSMMAQKMAIDYFLDALDDPDFELKIRE